MSVDETDQHGRADAPGLAETEVHPDPLVQFRSWFEAAVAARLPQPDAMALATATREGAPSARMVLLKGYDERGFVFFTNYESRKGREIAENPRAALVLYWPELRRQVRIEGSVEQLSSEASDAYFRTRPRDSQLAAWASRQSQVIESRAVLEQRMRALDEQYRGKPVPRPPYWGGYRLVPVAIEFWQGRPGRLHDRIRYRLDRGRWIVERLSP
ncbi:MAG TPA: pyridoxamine 5'-phosphate oxidase [Chloroflexota bacterium]